MSAGIHEQAIFASRNDLRVKAEHIMGEWLLLHSILSISSLQQSGQRPSASSHALLGNSITLSIFEDRI
jgi:hypothetical protein